MSEGSSELSRKIRLGEDSELELKSVRFKGDKIIGPHRDRLADELACMANGGGGLLVLGVDDKTREVEGIPLEKLDQVESLVHELCWDSIKPPLAVRIIKMELSDSLGSPRPVIRVDVPKSLWVHRGPGGYLERVGSSCKPLEPDRLARLFQQRSQVRLIRFDEQAVQAATVESLDRDLWMRFLPAGSKAGETIDLLRKLKIVTEDDAGHRRPTVSGVLMCCLSPEEWLPGAVIEAVRYRGDSPDSNYQVDAARISGPADAQIRRALDFVLKHMMRPAVKAPFRREWPQYSPRAIFEAVVNAVAHRDYSIYGSKIRLFLFDDRLEIFSPGGLPNTVTVESLPLRQSTRNELLTSLLQRCPVEQDRRDQVARSFFLEKRGEGVPIIIRETKDLANREPRYKLIDESELLLTIPAASQPPSDLKE